MQIILIQINNDKSKISAYIICMGARKKTVKVSILGLDGAGKSTTVAYFTKRFYKNYFIVKMGRSVYYYDRNTGEKVQLFTKLLKKVDNMYAKYEARQSRIGIVWASIFYVFATRYMESWVIRKLKPDIIIASRDISVDTVIYVDYYIPYIKYVPKPVLRFFIRLFSLFPKKSDMIVYLELDPKESIKRIKKRELKKKIDKSVMRIKSRYRHENFKDLKKIAENYDYYLKDYLFKKKGITVVYVNANEMHTKEKTDFCGKVIGSFMNKHEGWNKKRKKRKY